MADPIIDFIGSPVYNWITIITGVLLVIWAIRSYLTYDKMISNMSRAEHRRYIRSKELRHEETLCASVVELEEFVDYQDGRIMSLERDLLELREQLETLQFNNSEIRE